jgi:hypothetical protein
VSSDFIKRDLINNVPNIIIKLSLASVFIVNSEFFNLRAVNKGISKGYSRLNVY